MNDRSCHSQTKKSSSNFLKKIADARILPFYMELNGTDNCARTHQYTYPRQKLTPALLESKFRLRILHKVCGQIVGRIHDPIRKKSDYSPKHTPTVEFFFIALGVITRQYQRLGHIVFGRCVCVQFEQRYIELLYFKCVCSVL